MARARLANACGSTRARIIVEKTMMSDAVRMGDFCCLTRAGMKLQLLSAWGIQSSHADFQDKCAYYAFVG
jgi:hypothetical protein